MLLNSSRFAAVSAHSCDFNDSSTRRYSPLENILIFQVEAFEKRLMMVPTLSQRSDSMSSLSDTEHSRWVRPTFLGKLDDVRVKEGTDTLFRTRVSGDPHPKVRWYHNGKIVKRSDHIRHAVKVI